MLAQHGRGVLATRTPFQLHGSDDSPEPVWAVPVAVVAWLLAH